MARFSGTKLLNCTILVNKEVIRMYGQMTKYYSFIFLNFQTYIFTSFSCMNIYLFKRTGSCQFKYRLHKTKSFTFNLPIIINSTMISGFNNIVKESCNVPLTIFSKLYNTTFCWLKIMKTLLTVPITLVHKLV